MKKVLIIPNIATQLCEDYAKACVMAGLDPTISDTVVDERYFDGLILPGGADINPRFYGESNVACENVNLAFDQLEYKVLDDFVKAGKPILGICRGMQFINVYFGGTMIQHLPNYKEHISVDHVDGINTIKLEKDSFLYDIYKKDEIVTNSSHHQAIDKNGNRIRRNFRK